MQAGRLEALTLPAAPVIPTYSLTDSLVGGDRFMSTRSKRPRCVVCRNPLPANAQGSKCPPCVGQTVLFPKRAAERLTRRPNTNARTESAGGGR